MCGRLVNLDTVARVLADYYHLKTETQLAALDEALSRVPAETVGKELFGNSEQLEKDHIADPGNMVGDTISRAAAINAICEDGTRLERQGKYTMTMAERKQRDADILDALPSAQPEQLTDTEQRIFLAAMSREEKVCKKVDEEWVSGDEEREISLVHICHEIIRKVKGALWTI